LIDELQLFRGQDYQLNDYITLHQPTLNEICDYGEEKYYRMISCLTSTPSDYKVQLDDSGIDYETLNELDFFFSLCKELSPDDTGILLYDLDLSSFSRYVNTQNNETVYADDSNLIRIDANIHRLITDYIRIIHGITKNVALGGNEHSKKYLIEKERKKLSRMKNKPFKSMLIPLVSAMTNCENFKYNHDTVWDLHIYTFNDSVKRIQKIKSTDNLFIGIYNGCIDATKINQEELNWLGSLDK
jgi:hypothetical protein